MISCKNEKKQNETGKEEANTSDSISKSTYAEIWIKKGGSWEKQKYVGGKFEKVEEVELPESHTDHSGFIKYEGPGWENKNVAYRLYLDWRNAIDIFGKKVDTIVLPNVGQDGFNSYHEDAPWGQDILKAGKSLGIGGFGRFMNDSVIHFREVENTFVKINNSETSSEVQIEYSGWNSGNETIDLSAILSIYPEDRYTKVVLSPSGNISGLSTGLVKFDHIPLILKETEGGNWAYLATYGKQTLAGENDKLGMAIFYNKLEVEKTLEGPYDHLVIFKPGEKITYYLIAAWDQEKNGITTKEDFISNLDELLQKFNSNNTLK